MLKAISLTASLLAFVLFVPLVASAADVIVLTGTIVSPANLKQGGSAEVGTTIQAGADALVMVTQTWTSDIPGYPCESVWIFGYGQPYKVEQDATPGSCRVTAAPSIPAAGRPVLSRTTRYASPKFDAPKRPGPVVTSMNEWQAFDQWVVGQTVSAARRGGGAGVAQMGPLVPGLVYLQGDYRSQRVDSAEQCSALCAQDTQCRAVTFIISQRLCWLKNTVPATASSSDMVSAVKR